MFELARDALVEDRRRQAALAVVEVGLHQRQRRRAAGRGQKPPQRLLAQAAVGSEGDVGFHGAILRQVGGMWRGGCAADRPKDYFYGAPVLAW